MDDENVTHLTAKKKLQHFYFTFLSRNAVTKYELDIQRHGTSHDKARTFSNDGSLAGAWLHAVPKKNERHMDNSSFQRALMLRLGVPFYDRPLRCQ